MGRDGSRTGAGIKGMPSAVCACAAGTSLFQGPPGAAVLATRQPPLRRDPLPILTCPGAIMLVTPVGWLTGTYGEYWQVLSGGNAGVRGGAFGHAVDLITLGVWLALLLFGRLRRGKAWHLEWRTWDEGWLLMRLYRALRFAWVFARPAKARPVGRLPRTIIAADGRVVVLPSRPPLMRSDTSSTEGALRL